MYRMNDPFSGHLSSAISRSMVACLFRKVQIIPAKNWGNALCFDSNKGEDSALADCTNEVFYSEFFGKTLAQHQLLFAVLGRQFWGRTPPSHFYPILFVQNFGVLSNKRTNSFFYYTNCGTKCKEIVNFLCTEQRILRAFLVTRCHFCSPELSTRRG